VLAWATARAGAADSPGCALSARLHGSASAQAPVTGALPRACWRLGPGKNHDPDSDQPEQPPPDRLKNRLLLDAQPGHVLDSSLRQAYIADVSNSEGLEVRRLFRRWVLSLWVALLLGSFGTAIIAAAAPMIREP
jgi:hypothetical protein